MIKGRLRVDLSYEVEGKEVEIEKGEEVVVLAEIENEKFHSGLGYVVYIEAELEATVVDATIIKINNNLPLL